MKDIIKIVQKNVMKYAYIIVSISVLIYVY